MDVLTQSIVFAGAAPLMVNGRRYEVRPLSVQEITSNKFASSGLYCPGEAEATANWQAHNLQSEQYREALDKWLGRLLTYGGEPMSLQGIIDHRWRDVDVGAFLSLVLKASGLSKRAEKQEGGKAMEPEDWLTAITELQYRIHASWDDVMRMPLLRLNAVRKRVAEQAAQDVGGGLMGALGRGTPQEKKEPYVHPLLGSTPQPKTRDEYFDIVNGIRGR